MSETRFDHELEITLEDFENCKYQEILSLEDQKKFPNYCSALSIEAKKTIKAGENKIGKVLWLLSELSSFMLNPDNLQEPYLPYAVINGKRSVLPEDFLEKDIEFFENIIESCTNYRLKARMGDILWTLKKPKNIDHLKIAVNSYKKFPLDKEKLHLGTKDSIERALKLSMSAKQVSLLEALQDLLITTFHSAKVEEDFYCLHLNNLLVSAKIDISQNTNILSKLEEFSIHFKDNGQWRLSREYYQALKAWNVKLNNKQEINRLIVEVAESFVSEGQSRIDSQMAAATFYENAIQEFRSVPKVDRAALNVDKRITEVYQLMAGSNQLVRNEMSQIKTEGIDISESISQSIERIKDKKFEEALVIFANITHKPKFDSLKQSAKKILKTSQISRLFGCTYYSADGRVIGKTSGGLDNNDAYQEQLTAQIHQLYDIELGLIIQTSVFPAFFQLINQHRIRKEYLISLCTNSCVVPRERIYLWAEGLYFGFEKNYTVSTHILIPQIEHFVRLVLKDLEVQTTVLDEKGIEIEKGLSTLVTEPKLAEALGIDMVFDLKTLLTEQLGHNLRNNVAHGLSKQGVFHSAEAIYLWWFCFKMVVNNSHLVAQEKPKPIQKEVEDKENI